MAMGAPTLATVVSPCQLVSVCLRPLTCWRAPWPSITAEQVRRPVLRTAPPPRRQPPAAWRRTGISVGLFGSRHRRTYDRPPAGNGALMFGIADYPSFVITVVTFLAI